MAVIGKRDEAFRLAEGSPRGKRLGSLIPSQGPLFNSSNNWYRSAVA
jgi:hypothetical protein